MTSSTAPFAGSQRSFFFRMEWAACLAVLAIAAPSSARETSAVTQVTSPNGQVELSLAASADGLVGKVSQAGEIVVDRWTVGLQVDGESLTSGDASKLNAKSVKESWTPVVGKRSEVLNHYVEAPVELTSNSGKKLTAIFRVYDNGVAVRYQLPAGSGEHAIEKDLTSLSFAQDAECWSYAGENPNIGPESLDSIDAEREIPVLMRRQTGKFAAVHEAALYDAPLMQVKSDAGSKTLVVKVAKYTASAGFQTPWRVVLLGDSEGDILDSELLANLNPPCKIEDPSWVKPGVCFWDWRAWGHQVGDFTWGLDTPSWHKFVDFAQEMEVPYLLLDANWYGPEFEEESNPTETGKVNAVRELLAYAKERKVGILLYLNDVAGVKYDLEAVLKNYSDWGAVGIKYGFMKATGLKKVQQTRNIIELCAKHKLMVDFHDGPVTPTGDLRTWPNCLTTEFCHAQSDSLRAFTPGTFVTQVYVNGLAGPLDMANGLFDLENAMEERPRIFEEVGSTIVSEAARTLIVFNGLNVLPDSADAYREHKELFGFIAAQKMPWTESKTLQGTIGESITVMRQTGDTYLVGSATNEEGRDLEIALDFLPEGAYEATIFSDAADAHYVDNREAYEQSKQQVTSSDVLKATLAPGGGHAVILRPSAQ